MEHNNPNNNGTATLDDLYSNVPYAHYDIDDDEGDNYQEELEVTCYSLGDSEPFTSVNTYFFDTTWHNYAYPSKSMYCAVRSQESMYSILTGEMQARYTEFHGRTSSYTIGKETRSANLLNSEVNITAGATSEEKIVILPAVETIGSARAQMQEQWAEIETKQSIEEAQLLSNAKVVVTFTEPLNREAVNEMLQDAGASMQACTLKYEDENGMRITGWTDDISAAHLQEKLEYLQAEHGDITYAGVVGMNITMDLTDEDSYAALVNNNDVYLVDLSDPVTRLEKEDYDQELKIAIADASWILEP